MELQTSLIISSTNCQIKTDQKNQFSNFSHPLKVLKKTDNQMLQMIKHQQNIISSVLTMNLNNTNKIQPNSIKPQNPSQQQYFNQDQGILQHLHNSLQQKFQFQKCFILFGISINLLEIEQFCEKHQQLGLRFKFYKYSDNQFFREVVIGTGENSDQYKKIRAVLDGEELLDCEEVSVVVTVESDAGVEANGLQQDNVDQYTQTMRQLPSSRCTSPLRSSIQPQPLSPSSHKSSPSTLPLNTNSPLPSHNNKQQPTPLYHIYFFPNINSLKSPQQRRDQRTQLTLNSNTNQNLNNGHNTISYSTTLTSLRKSHQNFRILQVLQYYLKLECHSEHIMITANESLVIRDFMGLIYERNIMRFGILIDHERRTFNRTNKSTARSILVKPNKDQYIEPPQDNPQYPTPLSSNIYTSSISTQQQFITINNQLLINDQFLSKLSQIKLPEPWLDSRQFRQQKSLMYKMKLQQYQIMQQLKQTKEEFLGTINYLNSLIGLEKLTYDEVSLQSLKVIKNAKIKQLTQQVKELQNVWQEKDIRNDQLKKKIKIYQEHKNQKEQINQENLSALRKDILNIQKQLNLHRNQLSAIYHLDYCQHDNSQLNQQAPKGDKSRLESAKSKVSPKQIKPQQKVVQNKKSISRVQVKQNPSQLHVKPSQVNLKPSRVQTSKPLGVKTKQPLKPNPSQLVTKQSEAVNEPQRAKSPKSILRSKLTNQLPQNGRAESFLMNRRSSQLLSKYAPILEQLRKQKYEQSLKQQMTKCQFQAQKQYQKLKEDYAKACRDLKLILNDCD